MTVEDILEFCGYKCVSDLLTDHMNADQLNYLFEDLVNGPDDAKDFVQEEVERIASEYFEWVDRDALISQAEDMAYQKYRDGDNTCKVEIVGHAEIEWREKK
tara:strand:- start:2939 stop:3244 length:306 start_codon:yes stop_codon:yes gene_type:complete